MTIETMSSPKNVAGEMLTKTATTSAGHGENLSDLESVECPLCMETLDIDDLDFFPCSCEYQVCRFCWDRLKNDENGLCPACRQPYPELPIHFSSISIERVEEIKKLRKMKQKDKAKVKDSNKVNVLSTLRVVQKNLLFVIGIVSKVSNEELKKEFAKYGKIVKVVFNNNSAYVTFVRPEDAVATIKLLNETNKRPANGVLTASTSMATTSNGQQPVFTMLRASLGTTKYCTHWLRNQSCPKQPDCMYLHEVADSEASFTKEEMQLGKHTEYEKRLISHYLEVLEREQARDSPRDGEYLGTSPPNGLASGGDDKIRSYTFVNSKLGGGKDKCRTSSGETLHKHNAGGGSARNSKESSPDNFGSNAPNGITTWAAAVDPQNKTDSAQLDDGEEDDDANDVLRNSETNRVNRSLFEASSATTSTGGGVQLYSSSSSSTTSSGYAGSNGLAGLDSDQSSSSSSTSTPDNVVAHLQTKPTTVRDSSSPSKKAQLNTEEQVMANLLKGLEARTGMLEDGDNLFAKACKLPSSTTLGSGAEASTLSSSSMSFDFSDFLLNDHSSHLFNGTTSNAAGGAGGAMRTSNAAMAEAELDFDPISVCSRELDDMLRKMNHNGQLLGRGGGGGGASDLFGDLGSSTSSSSSAFGDPMRFANGGGLSLKTPSCNDFDAATSFANNRWSSNSHQQSDTLMDRFSKLNFNDAGGPFGGSNQLGGRPAPGFGGNPMFAGGGGGGAATASVAAAGAAPLSNGNNINQEFLQQYELLQQQKQQKMFNSQPMAQAFDGTNRNFTNNVLAIANMMQQFQQREQQQTMHNMKIGGEGVQWQQQQNSLRQMLPNVNIKFQQQQLGLNEAFATSATANAAAGVGFGGLTSQQQQNLNRLSQMESMFVNSIGNRPVNGQAAPNTGSSSAFMQASQQQQAQPHTKLHSMLNQQQQQQHFIVQQREQQQQLRMQQQQQQQQQQRSNFGNFFFGSNNGQQPSQPAGLLRSQQPPPGF